MNFQDTAVYPCPRCGLMVKADREQLDQDRNELGEELSDLELALRWDGCIACMGGPSHREERVPDTATPERKLRHLINAGDRALERVHEAAAEFGYWTAFREQALALAIAARATRTYFQLDLVGWTTDAVALTRISLRAQSRIKLADAAEQRAGDLPASAGINDLDALAARVVARALI